MKKTVKNPNPWVVVYAAGTDDEDIWSDHATYADATSECNQQTGHDGEGWDIMKRLDNGVLTTEY